LVFVEERAILVADAICLRLRNSRTLFL